MTTTPPIDDSNEQLKDLMITEEWFACSEHGSTVCKCALAQTKKAVSQLAPLLAHITEQKLIAELERAVRAIERQPGGNGLINVKARLATLKAQAQKEGSQDNANPS